MILACDCTSVLMFRAGSGKRDQRPIVIVPWFNQTKGAEFQDATYGKGMRLHNKGGKGKDVLAVCTLCEKVKHV